MNNYDDIKRFKEKLNMEGIDYKEIVENHTVNTHQNWAIIKQVATADEPFHPLEHGGSTQPTPTPISKQEFSAAPLSPLEQQPVQRQTSPNAGLINTAGQPHAPAGAPGQPAVSPLMSALSRALPLAEAPVSAPLPPAAAVWFDPPHRQQPAPARSAAPQTLPPPGLSRAPMATAPAPQPDNGRRFNQLFSKKSTSSAGIAQKTSTTPAREMPLSLLLENIALCR